MVCSVPGSAAGEQRGHGVRDGLGLLLLHEVHARARRGDLQVPHGPLRPLPDRRGEQEALQNHTCDWIYAWEPFAGNRPLIARGAVPFDALADADIVAMSRHWSSSRSQQLNMFDLL